MGAMVKSLSQTTLLYPACHGVPETRHWLIVPL